MRLTRSLAALTLFGVSFGYVEAAVVVYLRTIYAPLREQVLAGTEHDEIFPLLITQRARVELAQYEHVIVAELGRELATLVMLAAVGLALGGDLRRWFAGFMIAFGVWDIFYYVFLKLLLGWPASLWTWDILFLVPLPWVGPVITPCIVALSMIAAGVAVLWREDQGRPIRFRWFHWTAILAGGLTIIVAFCWDWRHILGGGMPEAFHWPLFLLGEAIGVAGFVSAASSPGTTPHRADMPACPAASAQERPPGTAGPPRRSGR